MLNRFFTTDKVLENKDDYEVNLFLWIFKRYFNKNKLTFAKNKDWNNAIDIIVIEDNKHKYNIGRILLNYSNYVNEFNNVEISLNKTYLSDFSNIYLNKELFLANPLYNEYVNIENIDKFFHENINYSILTLNI